MEIGNKEWREVIINGAENLGVGMTSACIDHFAHHATELVKWTQKTNLTSITDPLEIAVKHYLDSIAAVPLIPKESHMLDVGSGGGFPGIPLKIVMPSISATLIDGSRKKISFLNHIIRSLQLNRTKALQIRVENLIEQPDMQTAFHVVVSRALGDLNTFVRTVLPLLAPGGKIIAYRGKTLEKEIDMTYPFAIHSYRLPYVDSERSLIIFAF